MFVTYLFYCGTWKIEDYEQIPDLRVPQCVMNVKSPKIGWHGIDLFAQSKDKNTRGKCCLISQIRI